jgi:RHS repeat-associated protein
LDNKSGVNDQIISLPKGGGEIKGLGEKFRPDLHTGTGNYSIPVDLPKGRNGFQPSLSFNYSTGNPNSAFGQGWSIGGISGITRKVSNGVPRYGNVNTSGKNPETSEEEDVFILDGYDDLVPVGDGYYRPRRETEFLKIRKAKASDGQPYWLVCYKNGTRSTFGSTSASRIYLTQEDGTIKIFKWLCDETQDTFGNKIVYTYKRDLGENIEGEYAEEEKGHSYNQLYLESIQYVEYQEDTQSKKTKFLWRVDFDYGQYDARGIYTIKSWDTRPDRFSYYRAGFEIRTARRCKRILIKMLQNGSNQYELIRYYDLSYAKEKYSNVSLLTQVRLIGCKGQMIEYFPPLSFGYTEFNPRSKFDYFKPAKDQSKVDLPTEPLSNANYEILDIFGNALPCIINSQVNQAKDEWTYWRNVGQLLLYGSEKMGDPKGKGLKDDGVLFADVNGDASVELLVTSDFDEKGYWRKDERTGKWTKFVRCPDNVPNVESPSVKLVDLDGDSVVDILEYLSDKDEFRYYHNVNSRTQLKFDPYVTITRKQYDLPEFRREEDVRFADMSGDGMQDIVRIIPRFNQPAIIEYWPNLGHGRFGKKIIMKGTPTMDFKPERLFLTDVNGDGVADMVYVESKSIYYWINQSGNRFHPAVETSTSQSPAEIPNSVRVADMTGSGTAGVLLTYKSSVEGERNYRYLDFTGGVKPLLMNRIDNNMGALTRIEYRPSTWYYSEDEEKSKINPRDFPKWKTILPFPAQVVARVETVDFISGGKLTTEYRYHHGYWDGIEHEFHGFGRVDQLDTEEAYNQPIVDLEKQSFRVPTKNFSPPTETRTWFHQGSVGQEYGEWSETDFSDEFWDEDPQQLSRPKSIDEFLRGLPKDVKRDAIRSMRGKIIRTELYAKDGSEHESRPYTVTENMQLVLPLPVGAIWPVEPSEWQKKVFFPCSLASRTTEWERGVEPMTTFQFVSKHDEFGHIRSMINVGIPRGKNYQQANPPGAPYLVTHTVTTYSQRDDYERYIVDRLASATTFDINNDGTLSLSNLIHQIEDDKLPPNDKKVIGQQLIFYDGEPFQGLELGKIGNYGARTRVENLILTDDIISEALNTGNNNVKVPPYLDKDDAHWTEEYPVDFRSKLGSKDDSNRANLKVNLAGYGYSKNNKAFQDGYFAATEWYSYDFHDDVQNATGLVNIKRDPLGNDTKLTYDVFRLLPVTVTDAAELKVRVDYDYGISQPIEICDPNGNVTTYRFTPIGALAGIAKKGKPGKNEGDRVRESTQFIYNIDAFMKSKGKQPVNVCTIRYTHHDSENLPTEELQDSIKTVEFSDGFGRMVQSRHLSSRVIFGSKVFGDSGFSSDQSSPVGNAVGQTLEEKDNPVVVVSGWQVYDNKGNIIAKYEPFFSVGWEYGLPKESELGQKIVMYYDPRGKLLRTVNPDGSEQHVIIGKPVDISNPEKGFVPTPWEIHTYDANDNAGRTHPTQSSSYRTHWDTPSTIEIDVLGRKIKSIERNGIESEDWNETTFDYDIRGDLLSVRNRQGLVLFTYVYDLAPTPHAIRTQNMDSGIHITITNAAGNTIEQRDSKGSLVLHGYDVLNRRIKLWARDLSIEPVSLREFLIYGDDKENSNLNHDQAASSNLLGKLYKHYDEAGLVAYIPNEQQANSTPYDFKGNVLEKVRYVVKDENLVRLFDSFSSEWSAQAFCVDWSSQKNTTEEANEPELLDTFPYRVSFQYDAVNRATRIVYPQDVEGFRKAITFIYNGSGLLENVRLDGISYVDHISYNAKGQRIIVIYGNGLMTRYAYEPHTFHLSRIRTEHYEKYNEHSYRPKGDPLQDFGYEYDLAGNLLVIHDRTNGCGLPSDKDKLDRIFSYDPLYRLVSATGRECKMPIHNGMWSDEPRCGNYNDTIPYQEYYSYDYHARITGISHQADVGSFRKEFTYRNNSNRLAYVKRGEANYEYEYDANGNLVRETRSRHFEWDHNDRLRAFYTQVGSSEPSIYVHYRYNSAGMRVQKFVRKQGGKHLEVSIYVDGLFEHHRLIHGKQTGKEYDIIHITDDEKRIALVRIGIPFTDNEVRPSIQYQIGDHLDNTNIIADDKGERIDIEEFSPYGETTFGSFSKKRYRFGGKEREEETGMYYHGARYYLPWLALWSACDPAGSYQGPNMYAYAGNNPLRFTDPDGMQYLSSREEQIRSAFLCMKPEAFQLWIVRNGAASSEVQRSLGKDYASYSSWAAQKEDLRVRTERMPSVRAIEPGEIILREHPLITMYKGLEYLESDIVTAATFYNTRDPGRAGLAGGLFMVGGAMAGALETGKGRLLERSVSPRGRERIPTSSSSGASKGSGPPKIDMGEIKPISAYGEGLRQLSQRKDVPGNTCLVLYDEVGNAIMQVFSKNSAGTRVITWEGGIGKVEKLPSYPFGTAPHGNEMELLIRDLFEKATGQQLPKKHPSASGADLVPIRR